MKKGKGKNVPSVSFENVSIPKSDGIDTQFASKKVLGKVSSGSEKRPDGFKLENK